VAEGTNRTVAVSVWLSVVTSSPPASAPEIKTPEANLVDGMNWFQNTRTRRFNSRHKL